MGLRTWIDSWPVYRQLTTMDPLGRGAAAKSRTSSSLAPRTSTSDKVVKSICPYCAVGCGQNVYVKDEKVVQIEGDPDSPVSRGRLCPKGSASLQLTTGRARRYEVLYRRPHGTDWEVLPLEKAMDMIADRVIETRRGGWQWEVDGTMLSRRSRVAAAVSGAALVAASAATRWGIYHAGMASAADPKYTVVPQRDRLNERARSGGAERNPPVTDVTAP
jgi:formate dehydrogenase major subunit